jgi:two-component system, OmpR family, response regulator
MTRSRLRDPNRTSLVLAEENDGTRRDLVNALRGAGFWVKDVCRGHEALRAVHAHAPDLVITDLNLSDMDGVELVRELRSNAATRHIPVIGVSCRPTGDRERIGRAGFAQVVVNSCPFQQVVADVRAVLADRRQRPGCGGENG